MKIKITESVQKEIGNWLDGVFHEAYAADILDKARGYSVFIYDKYGNEICLTSDEYEVLDEN